MSELPFIMKPKLSVITVCYNSGPILEKTIQSVTDQTYPLIEYIVIDGGSNDGSVLILNKYRQQNKLKFISEPDNGIYDAMNKGIKSATGEWLFFLGSDDIFFNKQVVERIFANEYHDIEVIYGNVEYLHSGIIHDGPFDHEKISTKNICHQALFVKKSVYERIGVFNTKYKMAADHEFNLRWMGLNIRSLYIQETIVIYNEKGLSGQVCDQVFNNDFDQLLIDNNIVCSRSFMALKEKYEAVRYSSTFKVGNWLVRPFSILKNKLSNSSK